MGQYNPNAPLVVGNEYAPVLYSPYTPDLFVERGWSFRANLGFRVNQASLFFDSIPAWSVPGHAYLVTIYRRGQETSTGPLKTVTVPLRLNSQNNTATGGGAPTTSQAIANPSDGWYQRFRTGSTGESFLRLSSTTIPTELSEPALTQGKRIHDVSILYTASAEPGNEAPVPLQINHYYDVSGDRVPYGTATVDLAESLTTDIRRSRWGEIVTWFRGGFGTNPSPFTDDTSRAVWNYDLLTLFETGADFLVEFRTESAAQDGPREIFLHYAAMQITYSEENRAASWGVVLGSDYDLTGDTGEPGGYRIGRNTQGPTDGFGFNYPNAVSLASGGGGSSSGGADSINVFDGTVTVKRADYGPYNNQGPAGQLRALRTVDRFPGHPGIVITNTLEPGRAPTAEFSDLLPQIVIQSQGESVFDPDLTAAPTEYGHAYGVQWPLPVHEGSTVVQEIVPAAEAADTEYTKVRFWARSHGAQSALRLVIETADQGPVTVATLDPAELPDYPEIADGWHQVDLEVEPGLVIDDFSVASGTQPVVQDTVHEASGGTTASWNVTAPAGDLEGRLLLLLHGADTSDIADMGAPTGGATWNLLHDAENFDPGFGEGAARLWWKVGGAAEPASYGLTQSANSDGVAIVTAVQNVDETGLRSADTFNDPSSSINRVDTPDVPMDGQGGVDLRFAVGLFNNATWTPPNGWALLAGSVGTPYVSAGLAARTTDTSGGIRSMTSSVSDDLGRLGVTVTLPGTVIGPAAPRWESDTSLVRAWEVLGVRVVDPDLPDDVFDPADPSKMGIGTYGGALAEGGIEGDLPDTADIDVSVAWGQSMPEVSGLAVVEAVQPLEVVDPDCPIPPACIADGIRHLSVSWTPIDSGSEFVGLGNYELQRQDDTMGVDEWETVATPIHPLVDSFDDYEARVGVMTHYRIRYVHQNGMVGPWSATVSAEVAAPGVTGVGTSKGVLIFTSNTDPSLNLAYVQTWTGAADEDFEFVEAETRELQRMYGRDYQVAFRPLERGGVRFSRNLLVNAVTIPIETLRRGFVSLRDLAWADLPYVAVRSDRGDRWLANVNVPNGTIRDRRRLYMAEVQITEVTDQPFPVSDTVCEGMTARGALPSTVYEPRFATTPDEGQFDAHADLSLRVEMRLDQMEQRIPLMARFIQQTGRGWFLLYQEDGTLNFFIQGTAFADSEYESAKVPFGAGDSFWVRVDYDPDGGGATSTGQFFTSPDGSTWTPLATTAVFTDPIPGNDPTFADIPLTIGASADGTTNIPLFEVVGGAGGWNGVISRAQYLGDGGALLVNPDFASQDPDAVQFTDSQGNRWSVAGGICTVDRRL